MQPHEERRADHQIDFKQIKMVFWIMCLCFGGYVAAWGINENWKNQRFDNLALGQEKTWAKISTIDAKIDTVKDKETADYEYLLQHFQNGGNHL